MKLLIALALLTSSAFAQNSGVGNGGYSVVCRYPDGTIKSAQTLDIFEAKLRKKIYSFKNEKSEDEFLNQALHRLRNWPSLQEVLKKSLEETKANIIPVSPEYKLKLTFDAFPPIEQIGCEYEQLANYYQLVEVFVREEILNELDAVNVAAMHLHESLYAHYLKNGGSHDSTPIRRIVADLLTDKEDITNLRKHLKDLVINKRHIYCETEAGCNVTIGDIVVTKIDVDRSVAYDFWNDSAEFYDRKTKKKWKYCMHGCEQGRLASPKEAHELIQHGIFSNVSKETYMMDESKQGGLSFHHIEIETNAKKFKFGSMKKVRLSLDLKGELDFDFRPTSRPSFVIVD